MVGKALSNQWYDLPGKKGVDPDHAKRLEADAKLGKRLGKSKGPVSSKDLYWR